MSLAEISEFWSGVFHAGEQLQKMMLESAAEWHTIPIVGSIDTADMVMMNSLEYENPIVRPLIRSRLNVVGQLFHVNQVGHIDVTRMKTREEILNEFNCGHEAYWNTVVELVRSIKRRYAVQIASGTCMPRSTSMMELFVFRYNKGCSNATRLILKTQRQNWIHGNGPRSHMTYSRDGITDISESNFMKAFLTVRNSLLAPSFRWTATQVLLRTLWTKVKESSTRRGDGDDTCLNCGLEPEHTSHMLFSCELAREVREKLVEMLVEVHGQDYVIDIDTVLFHVHDENVQNDVQRDIDDLLLIYKHVIYRVRFRDNTDRIPRVRQILILIIFELQQLEFTRCKDGESIMGIQMYITSLRRGINWD